MTVNNGKTVHILYFAHLREERGLSQESLQTASRTLGELYNELHACHQFSFSVPELRVAVNNRFCDWNTEIQSHDQIVFIPPVSGG